MSEKTRKNFPQWIVDEVFKKQDGVCANSTCFNPLVQGFHRHHADGDNSNIKMENCRLLCLECHYKTFSENPYEEHKKFLRTLMKNRQSAIEKAINGTLSGSTLERVLSGINDQKKDSWKQKGLHAQVEYPSAEFALLRQLAKNAIVSEAYLEGYKAGVSSVTAHICQHEG